MSLLARIGRLLFLIFIVAASRSELCAQFSRQATLVGSGSVSPPPPGCSCPTYPVSEGSSVALSGDGNTAAVSGPGDYNGVGGAVWIFTRSNGIWQQQGDKLIGSGAAGNAPGTIQSVAISADGNTVLLGRPGDDSLQGAVWVFSRIGGVWSQQGDKLVGSGSIGPYTGQGGAVALSADGNTAVFDGRGDNHNVGAVWVFTRSNGVWSQDGEKLVSGGVGGAPYQCCAAIAGDGQTIVFLGLQPGGGGNGFASVFVKEHGTWSQQGGLLIGSTVGGSIYQGITAALSGDGNTAIVAGYDRVSLAAYAWIFVRTGGVWREEGSRLEAGQPLGAPATNSVSLSADGGTALVNNSIFMRDQRGLWRTDSIAAAAGPAALSGDASTVIVGEPQDSNGLGAVVIFAADPAPTRRTFRRRPVR